MTILVTGASGFIGANLQRYLKVHCPDITIKTLGRSGSTITWDALTADKLRGIAAIVHLAGKAHDTKNTSAPQDYFDINFGLTKALFDYALMAGVQKFIYVSSVKAAADTVADVLTESDIPAPQTPYGKSKLQAENYLTQHSQPGIDVYILRPCMVHGPGNKGNLNLLYQFAKRGIPYPLAAFKNKRSFLSVENFCFVTKELLTRKVATGIYNLADDEPLSTTELIALMAEVQGRKAALWQLPPALVRKLAATGDRIPMPLNSERLKKLTESYVVSNTKLKQALQIDTMPVSAHIGLRKTIESFRQTKANN